MKRQRRRIFKRTIIATGIVFNLIMLAYMNQVKNVNTSIKYEQLTMPKELPDTVHRAPRTSTLVAL